MMKIKVLLLILCISSIEIGCVSSSKYRQSNKKIATLEEANSKLTEKDALSKVNLAKIKELESQLDKTERVLAKIYLQYANNTPKKLESTTQTLSSQIAEESLNLKLENQTLIRQIDSLKSIPIPVPAPSNPPTEIINAIATKPSKKQFTELQKNYEAQTQYLQQIESNYNKSLQTISQLNKSLNGYSLKLEIMDNEKNKAVKDIQEKLEHKNQELDSLIKISKASPSKPPSISEITTNDKDSKKIQKQKDQINQLIKDLEASKDNLRTTIKAKEQLEIEQNKLTKNLDLKDQKINQLTNEKTDLQNNITANQNQLTQLSNSLEIAKQEIIKLKEKITFNENTINQLIEKNNIQEKDIQNKIKDLNNLKENQNPISKDEYVFIKSENERLSNELNNYKASQKADQQLLISEQQKNLTNKITEQAETINKQNQQILELSKKASKNNSNLKMSEYQDSLIIKNSTINKLESAIKTLKINTEKQNTEYSSKLSSLELKLTETEDKNKELSKINIDLLKRQNTSVSKTERETSMEPDSNLKKPKKFPEKAVVPNKTTAIIEKPKPNYTSTDANKLKLQKLISEVKIPGASVTKDNKTLIIAIPQSSLFLVETAALTMDGVSLVQKIYNAVQPIKSKQIDIIAYTSVNKNSDDFNLIRSKTIGKLLIALGIPANNINYGSRQYQEGADATGFSEGIEILVKVE